ncbi:MAG TPA: hypothetical protein VFT50_16175 [Baekduia sp.]|nr:hypothetical protein [Baekduia sp.]
MPGGPWRLGTVPAAAPANRVAARRQQHSASRILSRVVAEAGPHAANGITAMFIATGPDVANVAESSAAFVHAGLRPNACGRNRPWDGARPREPFPGPRIARSAADG